MTYVRTPRPMLGRLVEIFIVLSLPLALIWAVNGAAKDPSLASSEEEASVLLQEVRLDLAKGRIAAARDKKNEMLQRFPASKEASAARDLIKATDFRLEEEHQKTLQRKRHDAETHVVNDGKLEMHLVSDDELSKASAKVQALSRNTAARDASMCRTMGVGRKQCGGPAYYIAYSVQHTNESKLREASEALTRLSRVAWQQQGLRSNCSLVTDPGVAWINGKCRLLNEGESTAADER